MAKEYIDREAAIKIIRGEAVAKYPDSFYVGLIAASNELNVIPAADVAPVVQGEWICVDTDDEQFFLCNRCKDKEYWESNYCPNCGAKMDGEQKEGAE